MIDNTLLVSLTTDQPLDSKERIFYWFFKSNWGKTKCKKFTLVCSQKKIYMYILMILQQSYQIIKMGLAEGFMGIHGKLKPNVLKGIGCDHMEANEFIKDVINKTIIFYSKIPQDLIYKGIVSECETFIQNINKYIYLFKLCNTTEY